MKEKSYYDLLEVNENADADEIKKSYRRLTLRWHPDRNPNDKDAEENFKKISVAYSIISDPEKRRVYDLGFDPNNEVFDRIINKNLLNSEEDFVRLFSTIFGDLLDEKIPGGFRGRVDRVSKHVNKKKKSESCRVCHGKKRVPIHQGSFVVYITCRSCF